MATIQIRTRINRNLKKDSDAVLKSIGLDAGSYVTMALTQLVNRRGIPFAVMEPDRRIHEVGDCAGSPNRKAAGDKFDS